MKRLALVAILALAGCGDRNELPAIERPDVLVITLDTLRADRMGLYGYERNTTPNLDAFASECFVFENAFSNSSFTPPSHASILTGRFPSEHGLMHWKRRLDQNVDTAASLFGERGYRTAAFTPMGTLLKLGLDRGFDSTFTPDHRPFLNGILLADGREMNAAALPWLNGDDQPFFAWLHYYDAHRPFAIAGREWASMYRPDPDLVRPEVGDGGQWYQLDAADRRKLDITPGQTEYIKDRYDGGVNQVDLRVGELLDELRSTGVLDRAWVVITGDHGEVLDEHDEEWFSHDPHLVDENIHVPLLVRPPGGLAKTKRFSALVQGVDILPTLLDVTGSAGESFSGTSFAPLLRGDTSTTDTFIFADRIGDPLPKKKNASGANRDPTEVEIRRSRDRKQIVRTDTHKLIVHLDRKAPGSEETGTVELWEIGREGVDVQESQPEVFAELRDMLGEQLLSLAPATEIDGDMDDATLQNLKDLGYIPPEDESDL